MDNAIAILSSELASIESKIHDDKGNDKRLIDKKNQILEAIRWLKQLQKFSVEWGEIRIIQLKDTGYCHYRLLVDDETDNRNSWIEISLDGEGKGLRLSGGDILIVKK